MNVTPKRTVFSVGELPLSYMEPLNFLTVSITKRLRNDRFNSETAVRQFQKRNGHLDPELG
jgi:hypothetical protein